MSWLFSKLFLVTKRFWIIKIALKNTFFTSLQCLVNVKISRVISLTLVPVVCSSYAKWSYEMAFENFWLSFIQGSCVWFPVGQTLQIVFKKIFWYPCTIYIFGDITKNMVVSILGGQIVRKRHDRMGKTTK